MKIKAHAARSAAAAANGRKLRSCLSTTATSQISTMSSNTAMKGITWSVATDRAKTAAAVVTLATQVTGARSGFHASAVAAMTKAARMIAVASGDNTLKLRVSSQSI